MTVEQFTRIWVENSAEVADEFYPEGRRRSRRGEYLRDQAVLCVKILAALQGEGVIEE